MPSLIKSGTDFRDLSEANLALSPPNDNAVRRRVVTALTGKHHYVIPTSPTSPQLDKLVHNLLQSVTKTLSQPVCYTLTPFDARSEVVRTEESALGNWAADVLLHAYDESLVEKNTRIQFEKGNAKLPEDSEDGADAVIICGGTLRGDSQYGPGIITLGDILGTSEEMIFSDVAQRSSHSMTLWFVSRLTGRAFGTRWRALSLAGQLRRGELMSTDTQLTADVSQ